MNKSNNELNNDDLIDLQELFTLFWEKKFYVGIITSSFALLSILYALSIPNIYNSVAIMMPLEKNQGMGGIVGQFGDVASMAGISLPSANPGSKSQEAMARIKSFDFFSNYFLPNIKLENLLAVKSWEQASNTLLYKNFFNAKSGKWGEKAGSVGSSIPSSQRAFQKYQQLITISEANDTLFVYLSVDHESPFIAQQWVELIINKIDQVMRDGDRQDATNSIQYLNTIVPSINYESIKTAFSAVQQEQMKKLMLVEASENYIFKVLDSPRVPEFKSRPSRSVIVILGTLLGLMLSLLSVLVFHYSKKSSK